MDAQVDQCRRVITSLGTDRNTQLNFSDIPFQINPDLVLPSLRLKTVRGFHAQLDSSGSFFLAKSERHIT